MDIPQRTMNAVGKRDESIRRWANSSTAKAPQKTDDTHFKITFDNGSMLLSAVSSGDIEEAVRLLQLGADVNYSSADGLTALHQACIDESIELVEILVNAGANVNARDNEGWSPLHAAASTTSLEVVSFLVKHGANLAAVNTDGELAVDLADEDDIKEFLMEEISARNINLKSARNLEHDRMMQDISKWISKGHVEEIPDPQGASALHVAASKSYMDIMEILVDRLKVDINIKDNDGWTPLHAAVYWKQLDAIAFLLDHDADYQAKTTIGLLPIDLADDDIILKYKSMLRKKNVALTYSKRSTTNDDFSDDVEREVYPHSYKQPISPILKKPQEHIKAIPKPSLVSPISRPPIKSTVPNVARVTENIAIPSASLTNSPIRPPSTLRTPSLDKEKNYQQAPTSVQLPPKLPATSINSSNIAPKPAAISSTVAKDTNIATTTTSAKTINTIPRPGAIAKPPLIPASNISTQNTTIKTPNSTPTTHISVSRPPLPARSEVCSKISRPPPTGPIAASSEGSVETLKFTTLNEAIIEINRLNRLIEDYDKEKKQLLSEINELKNPENSNINVQNVLQENKRLQQENKTLIRAMSTLNKSKSDSRSS